VIVSPLAASETAWRREPAPLSLTLVTTVPPEDERVSVDVGVSDGTGVKVSVGTGVKVSVGVGE
jgi:hypothetical protein